MLEKLGSVLIAEVGSITTRVTLVDTVEGESRLIGRAEAASSVEPPYSDALIGILEAAARIEKLTERQILQEGRLMKPQNNERDGINHVVVTSSAAGNLELIITAIARDVSARSALHATRSTYTSVLQTVTLDDAALDEVLRRTTSWVERQVQTMLALRPDVILFAGGLEGGARDSIGRLARVLAFTVAHLTADVSKRQQSNVSICPVIYAGNSQAQARVIKILSERAETIVVDNLRPTMDKEHLEPVRKELTRLYDKLVLSRLPGMSALERLSSAPVSTVCASEGLITRFLAERYDRQVLSLNVGATSSSALLAGKQRFIPAVLGTCGTGYGLPAVMEERGLERIARWLPFSISDVDLRHWLLNKVLRPHIVPTSLEDVLIEHAVTREALAMVLEALTDECTTLHYDLIVAGGGVLAHAFHPGLAALTVLDALQPTGEGSEHALDMHLDIFGLLPACGALAGLSTEAAATLFERDLLRNEPLATCVIALGGGRSGDVAVEAELTSRYGRSQRVTVRHGQVARLPLSPGTTGQLTLKPASGVRLGGSNAPGEEVRPDLPIQGSALGVVIDARGRPLQLPRDDTRRRTQLWEWLVALGVTEGHSPYLDSSVALSLPETIDNTPSSVNGRKARVLPTQADRVPPDKPESRPAAPQPAEPSPPPAADEESEKIKPGTRISLADLAKEEQRPAKPPKDAESTDNLQSDLDQLRGTVEKPEKRGWFGRKK